VALATDALRLSRLTLRNFRNYEALHLTVGTQAVVLTGANGGGKTNLLEAISLLAPGRGLRGAAFEELVRHGADGHCRVTAEISGPNGEVAMNVLFRGSLAGEADQETRGREVSVDGIPQRLAGTLGQYMRVVWITPAMDRLFSGPASARRRFLDRLVAAIDPEHGRRTATFERLMRERSRLISEPLWDTTWLGGIEQQMAEAAVAVAAGRLAAVEALQGAARTGGEPAPFPWVSLAVAGEMETMLAEAPAIQVEDHYRRILHDSRSKDGGAGRTLHGPHRSDFIVTYGPRASPAASCSTGEQKALLIAIVIAHARAMRATPPGVLPVLLFDEGVAHLDRSRRVGLFETLTRLGAQCWFAGTDRELFAGLETDTEFYAVDGGLLTPTG
jgi:DNA replication and repair protein RecF